MRTIVLERWITILAIPHRLVVAPSGDLVVQFRLTNRQWMPCHHPERHIRWFR